jgi:hypothetical protein
VPRTVMPLNPGLSCRLDPLLSGIGFVIPAKAGIQGFSSARSAVSLSRRGRAQWQQALAATREIYSGKQRGLTSLPRT